MHTIWCILFAWGANTKSGALSLQKIEGAHAGAPPSKSSPGYFSILVYLSVLYLFYLFFFFYIYHVSSEKTHDLQKWMLLKVDQYQLNSSDDSPRGALT